MKKSIKVLSLAFLATFILSANKCKDKTPEKDMKCEHIGEIIDMTGLDGCGLMIELKDEKLEVVEWPSNYSPVAGDKISFDFEEATDMMSICMAGKMVKVTCVEKF